MPDSLDVDVGEVIIDSRLKACKVNLSYAWGSGFLTAAASEGPGFAQPAFDLAIDLRSTAIVASLPYNTVVGLADFYRSLIQSDAAPKGQAEFLLNQVAAQLCRALWDLPDGGDLSETQMKTIQGVCLGFKDKVLRVPQRAIKGFEDETWKYFSTDFAFKIGAWGSQQGDRTINHVPHSTSKR